MPRVRSRIRGFGPTSIVAVRGLRHRGDGSEQPCLGGVLTVGQQCFHLMGSADEADDLLPGREVRIGAG
ncbi:MULTISPECIES: hypothetical protein [unclassified Streptomyces]|uniref:hypothetical protein n=1 Tax=unclassified Streptomyces TaxID=2593676 RepID=UPI000DBA0217|nr:MULTISPECIES: hypothetical protein [unclassified Streptomyces]MYT69655.1 hypothetical protein [Streptomyces sp. SID8367]RAJ70719.1 hypothetical protein K377_07795 [Streptomyces sp. PsTaAH-137]